MSNAYIYILTNERHTVLYVGCTEDLVKRVYLHRNGLLPGFTKKYNVNKLVYIDECRDIGIARAKEKALKSGSRARKIKLIKAHNPNWVDLYPTLTDSPAKYCNDKENMTTSLVTI